MCVSVCVAAGCVRCHVVLHTAVHVCAVEASSGIMDRQGIQNLLTGLSRSLSLLNVYQRLWLVTNQAQANVLMLVMSIVSRAGN